MLIHTENWVRNTKWTTLVPHIHICTNPHCVRAAEPHPDDLGQWCNQNSECYTFPLYTGHKEHGIIRKQPWFIAQ